MKSFVKSALVAFGLTVAMGAPAFAQPWGGPGPGWNPGPGGPGGPGGAQPRIVVPPGGGGCQAAAQSTHVVFQWHEAQQLCQQNPWSNRPVRCVEDLQRYGIPVWQAVNVCRMAR